MAEEGEGEGGGADYSIYYRFESYTCAMMLSRFVPHLVWYLSEEMRVKMVGSLGSYHLQDTHTLHLLRSLNMFQVYFLLFFGLIPFSLPSSSPFSYSFPTPSSPSLNFISPPYPFPSPPSSPLYPPPLVLLPARLFKHLVLTNSKSHTMQMSMRLAITRQPIRMLTTICAPVMLASVYLFRLAEGPVCVYVCECVQGVSVHRGVADGGDLLPTCAHAHADRWYGSHTITAATTDPATLPQACQAHSGAVDAQVRFLITHATSVQREYESATAHTSLGRAAAAIFTVVFYCYLAALALVALASLQLSNEERMCVLCV